MGFFKKLSMMRGNVGVFTLDTTQVELSLKAYLKELSLPETPKEVLGIGADVVVKAVRQLPYPKSRKTHYYYRRGKKVEIKPGNLLKSTRKYFTSLKEYEIGPKILYKVPDTFGASVYTSSGYYASALYGSASAYRRRVLEPQLQDPGILTNIVLAFGKWHKRQNAAR